MSNLHELGSLGVIVSVMGERALARVGWLVLVASWSAAGCVATADIDDYTGPGQAGGAASGSAGASSGGRASGVGGSAGGASPSSLDTPQQAGGATEPPTSAGGGNADEASSELPGGDAGGGNEVPPDLALFPQLVASSPPDGAAGVAPDAPLRLTFNRSMDQTSVLDGLDSDDLPLEGAEAQWNEAGTELTLAFAEELEVASGSDPETLPARTYELRLRGARDAEGTLMEDLRIAFSTLRHFEVVLPALASPDATGNWRSDGNYGSAPCDETGNRVCVGDSGVQDDERYYGFVGLDLSSLLVDELVLQSALLELDLVAILGAPFRDLGTLEVEPIAVASIGPAAFIAPAAGEAQAIASAVAGETMAAEIGGALSVSLEAGAATGHLRLRFSQATDGDQATDLLFFDRTTLRVLVAYDRP